MRFDKVSELIGGHFGVEFPEGEMPPFQMFVEYFLGSEEQFRKVYERFGSECLDFLKNIVWKAVRFSFL